MQFHVCSYFFRSEIINTLDAQSGDEIEYLPTKQILCRKCSIQNFRVTF